MPRSIDGATTFGWYQLKAKRTMMKFRTQRERLAYLGLGLTGEAGEAVDNLKKALYHGHDLDLDNLKKEMGDCLWYLANLAEALDFDLGEVAVLNIDKLEKRYPIGFSEEASINRQEAGGTQDG